MFEDEKVTRGEKWGNVVLGECCGSTKTAAQTMITDETSVVW